MEKITFTAFVNSKTHNQQVNEKDGTTRNYYSIIVFIGTDSFEYIVSKDTYEKVVEGEVLTFIKRTIVSKDSSFDVYEILNDKYQEYLKQFEANAKKGTK